MCALRSEVPASCVFPLQTCFIGVFVAVNSWHFRSSDYLEERRPAIRLSSQLCLPSFESDEQSTINFFLRSVAFGFSVFVSTAL